MFYPMILLTLTLRQHNTKQQCKKQQKAMKRNGLSLPMVLPKWEPIKKPGIKLRINSQGTQNGRVQTLLTDHVFMTQQASSSKTQGATALG